MDRRLIFSALAGLFITAKTRAAQTLVRGSQLFVPAITGNMVRLLRAPGIEVLADLGPSLRTTTMTNPARVQLDVEWSAAPAPPPAPAGLTIVPRVLTMADGKYTNSEPITAKHLCFCNGLMFTPGDDYTVTGAVITPLHPAMLEDGAKVVLAY